MYKQIFETLVSDLAKTASAIIDRMKSRKFQAWIIATIAFFMGLLPADMWQIITMLYMGIQGALDWSATTTGPKSNQTPN